MEVCLHNPHIKHLEDAWTNLPEVNKSLSDQQQGVFLLWKYITEKIQHRAKQWYKISKDFMKTQDSIDTDIILKWFQDLRKCLAKSQHAFVVIKNEMAYKSGKEAERQSLASLIKVNHPAEKYILSHIYKQQ